MMPISELRVHPKNLEISSADDEIVEHLVPVIKEHGVLTPLIVTPSRLVISDICWYYAALKVGLKELPVEVRAYRDELDEIEAIIESNKQRELSKEQKVRVGIKFLQIEKERAKARVYVGVKIDSTGLSKESVGNTRDIIAKRIGFGSGQSYMQAERVVSVIDTLPEDKAQALRALLEKSTVTAYQIVREGLIEWFWSDIIANCKDERFSAADIHRKLTRRSVEWGGKANADDANK